MAVETVRIKNIGLRGVTVADTKISYIDGENGISDLSRLQDRRTGRKSTFMETAFLLLHGYLPEGERNRTVRKAGCAVAGCAGIRSGES